MANEEKETNIATDADTLATEANIKIFAMWINIAGLGIGAAFGLYLFLPR